MPIREADCVGKIAATTAGWGRVRDAICRPYGQVIHGRELVKHQPILAFKVVNGWFTEALR